MSGPSLRQIVGLLVACGVSLPLSGCLRGCDSRRPPIHLNPNMDDQPKYEPLSESSFFYTGSTSQAPVPGTIARGELHENEALYTGRDAQGSWVENPLPVNDALVARGRERFQIYCVPCHGTSGDGRGMLYRRAQFQSADLLGDEVRQMPDGQLFDVITNGTGLMQGYAYPVPPRDRWAIVAYVRRLESNR